MIYRVRDEWPLAYRGHCAGEEFSANLEPDVELRAIEIGAIEILDSTRESIDGLNVTPPRKSNG